MRRLIVVAMVIVAFGLGLVLRGTSDAPTGPDDSHADHQQATTWTCSMHPQIKLPQAGQCPICFMDLIPLVDDEYGDAEPRTLVLSEAAVALAEIQTSVVERRQASADIRLTGKIDYDETRRRTISAWVPGRIDTLFVDFTGTQVAKGQPLVSLYSPQLYTAQTEFLGALQARRDLGDQADPLLRGTAEATVSAARERMMSWGLTRPQIDGIAARGTAARHLRILSPIGGVVVHKNAVEGAYVQTGTVIYTIADLSRVWVNLDAYESDLLRLREKQPITFNVEALPGRDFAGTIAFIDPILDNRTRTVTVRVDADNAQGLLKPGLFVSAIATAGVDDGAPSLVIPATAPLITGKRAVVYVRRPDTERPTYTGRDIVLGPRVGDAYIVASGLEAGEVVVTRGNFKIDSALQIKAEPSMMNPGTEKSKADAVVPIVTYETPAAFLEQLGGVLTAYLDLQAALAGDDDAQARDAARDAGKALALVDMKLVSGDAHLAWMKHEAELRKAFAAIAASGDIVARRRHFLKLAQPFWDVLDRFGYRQNEPLRLFNCPMADDNKGGDWIQLQTTTANPYFGASMLRCGSQVDSLAVETAGSEGKSR